MAIPESRRLNFIIPSAQSPCLMSFPVLGDHTLSLAVVALFVEGYLRPCEFNFLFMVMTLVLRGLL